MKRESAKSLKSYLDAKKKPTRMLGDIERHLLTREQDFRATDVLHPSEIIKSDWCLRRSWFLLNGRVPAAKRASSMRLENIFAEGHAIHAKWQGWLREMGVLYGQWDTHKMGSLWSLSEGVPTSWTYLEVPMLYPEFRIRGHADGWVKGLGDDFLIEIKSIGIGTIRHEASEIAVAADFDLSKAFQQIKRPFKSHLLQGRLYLECVRDMYGDAAPSEIVFLYECKADQAYKEFVIGRDRESVQPILDKAESVVAATTPPPCSNSITGSCPQCREFEAGA